MSADFMTVRLHLPGVRVTGVVVDTPTELVVGVVSVKKLSKCPHCGCSCRRVHDRRQREIRDLEHGGRRTVLLWTQRRLVCDHCGKRHIETHPQFEGCMTRRLARRLVQDAQVMPIRAVSRRHRISWHLIMELVTDWSGRGRGSASPSKVSGVADRRDIDQKTPPVCDRGGQWRHRGGAGHVSRTV